MTPVYGRCAVLIYMTANSSLLPIKQLSGQNGASCTSIADKTKAMTISFSCADCQVPPISVDGKDLEYVPMNLQTARYSDISWSDNVGSTGRLLVWWRVSSKTVRCLQSSTCQSFSWRHIEDLQCDDLICAYFTKDSAVRQGWISPTPGVAYHLSWSLIRQGARQDWWVSCALCESPDTIASCLSLDQSTTPSDSWPSIPPLELRIRVMERPFFLMACSIGTDSDFMISSRLSLCPTNPSS